ncbi:glutathione S-transferase [Shewanella aestuarii]|uniref:Glutathione S-transferase n=1 Tax=Shewanella aestuarii TaxID=1028752 RepID=A0A6G9QKA4_9GAMM|nr:glutathione S-transferase [Shewanella aestuarii]QIR14299.1 glutathione S-transferase [Shewanella aestuarii]
MNYLYSFRRCPYAMRARIGLHLSRLNPAVREIELKNKPSHMLEISPKGTVPILVYQGESSPQIIAESIDIFKFAINHFPTDTSPYLNQKQYQLLQKSLNDEDSNNLIFVHDSQFKPWLDKYKYADRHPQMSQIEYRIQAEVFIKELEAKLTKNEYLFAASPTFADFAIFPFIRQFAAVDQQAFAISNYVHTETWLAKLISSELFIQVMKKYPIWLPTQETIYLK